MISTYISHQGAPLLVAIWWLFGEQGLGEISAHSALFGLYPERQGRRYLQQRCR
jgi:hypothetical protein